MSQENVREILENLSVKLTTFSYTDKTAKFIAEKIVAQIGRYEQFYREIGELLARFDRGEFVDPKTALLAVRSIHQAKRPSL